MLYVQLDTNWPDHPKIIRAGLDGAGLHAVVLCLAKRLETDGWVPRPTLHRQGATDELIDRLVGLDLLEDGEGAVRPDGWLDRNPSQAAIDAKRAMRSEGGRRGNHERWKHPGSFEDCEKCQVIAGSDRGRSAGDRLPSPKSETEVGTAIAPAIAATPPRRIDAEQVTRLRQTRAEVFAFPSKDPA